jgi:Nucleotidyl transferase AbiEii toxin, Type IV TA system
MNQNYIDTVQLLLAITPEVFASDRFAMKGGTALNLFVQDMPRRETLGFGLKRFRSTRRSAPQVIHPPHE